MNKLLMLLPFLIGCVELQPDDRHAPQKISILTTSESISFFFSDAIIKATHIWDPVQANIKSLDELTVGQQFALTTERRINIVDTTLPLNIAAEYAPLTDVIYISTTMWKFKTDECITNSIAHELGHAMGLGHVNGQESIMYASQLNCSTKLSSLDVDEWYTTHGGY